MEDYGSTPHLKPNVVDYFKKKTWMLQDSFSFPFWDDCLWQAVLFREVYSNLWGARCQTRKSLQQDERVHCLDRYRKFCSSWASQDLFPSGNGGLIGVFWGKFLWVVSVHQTWLCLKKANLGNSSLDINSHFAHVWEALVIYRQVAFSQDALLLLGCIPLRRRIWLREQKCRQHRGRHKLPANLRRRSTTNCNSMVMDSPWDILS